MSRTGRIHAARLDRSPRLQLLLALLIERGQRGATTREIVVALLGKVVAVNSCIDELRENGFFIPCESERETDQGGHVYRYRFTGFAPQDSKPMSLQIVEIPEICEKFNLWKYCEILV